MLAGIHPDDPLLNVIPFEESVGRKPPATLPMGTGIGHQDTVPMAEKKLCVSNHSHTVVAEPMQQNDGVAVVRMRHYAPSTQNGTVLGLYRDALYLRIEVVGELPDASFVRGHQSSPPRMNRCLRE